MGTRTLKNWVNDVDKDPEIIIAYEFSSGRTFRAKSKYPFSDIHEILDGFDIAITDESDDELIDI